MEFVGKAIAAVDKALEGQDTGPQFSERLFYNIGRLYTYGLVFGACRGLVHQPRRVVRSVLGRNEQRFPANSLRSVQLDRVSEFGWHDAISFAKVGFLYSPCAVYLRRLAPRYADDVAWGLAWAVSRQSTSLYRRALVGAFTGGGHFLVREYGADLVVSAQKAARFCRKPTAPADLVDVTDVINDQLLAK